MTSTPIATSAYKENTAQHRQVLRLVLNAILHSCFQFSTAPAPIGQDVQLLEHLRLRQTAIDELELMSEPLRLDSLALRSLRIAWVATAQDSLHLELSASDLDLHAACLPPAGKEAEANATAARDPLEPFPARLARFLLRHSSATTQRLLCLLPYISGLSSWGKDTVQFLAEFIQTHIKAASGRISHCSVSFWFYDQKLQKAASVAASVAVGPEEEGKRSLDIDGVHLDLFCQQDTSESSSSSDEDDLSAGFEALTLSRTTRISVPLDTTKSFSVFLSISPASLDIISVAVSVDHLQIKMSQHQLDPILAFSELMNRRACSNDNVAVSVSVKTCSFFLGLAKDDCELKYPLLRFELAGLQATSRSVMVDKLEGFEQHAGDARRILAFDSSTDLNMDVFDVVYQKLLEAKPVMYCFWADQQINVHLCEPLHLLLDLDQYIFFKPLFDCFDASRSQLHSDPAPTAPLLTRLSSSYTTRITAPALCVTAAVRPHSTSDESDTTALIPIDRLTWMAFNLHATELVASADQLTCLASQALIALHGSCLGVPTFFSTGQRSSEEAARPQVSLTRQDRGEGDEAAPWAADVSLPSIRLHIDQDAIDSLTSFVESASSAVPSRTKLDLSLRVADVESKIYGRAEENVSPRGILAQMSEGILQGQLDIAPL